MRSGNEPESPAGARGRSNDKPSYLAILPNDPGRYDFAVRFAAPARVAIGVRTPFPMLFPHDNSPLRARVRRLARHPGWTPCLQTIPSPYSGEGSHEQGSNLLDDDQSRNVRTHHRRPCLESDPAPLDGNPFEGLWLPTRRIRWRASRPLRAVVVWRSADSRKPGEGGDPVNARHTG